MRSLGCSNLQTLVEIEGNMRALERRRRGGIDLRLLDAN
jgi:hypothetical protein